MRTPIRKPGKYTHNQLDPYITGDKFKELKINLDRLKKKQLPAKQEVERLALHGDFSENAAYQVAKGRLRGINQGIHDIEKYLKKVIIIKPSKNKNIVQLGSIVTIEMNRKEKTYTILGSTETNPSKGIISHNSPIGLALMNKGVGDIVEIKIANKKIKYKIINID